MVKWGYSERVDRSPNASERIRNGFLGKTGGSHWVRLSVIQEKIRNRFGTKHMLLHECTQGCLVGFYISLDNNRIKMLKMCFIIYVTCISWQYLLKEKVYLWGDTVPPHSPHIKTRTEIKSLLLQKPLQLWCGTKKVGVVYF